MLDTGVIAMGEVVCSEGGIAAGGAGRAVAASLLMSLPQARIQAGGVNRQRNFDSPGSEEWKGRRRVEFSPSMRGRELDVVPIDVVYAFEK